MIMSADEYERLKRHGWQALAVEEMPSSTPSVVPNLRPRPPDTTMS